MSGMQYIPAGKGAVIITLNPAITLLVAAWLFGEKLNPVIGLGMVLSLSGAMVAVSHGDISLLWRGGVGAGEALILGAALCWSSYTLLSRVVMKGIPPLTATAVSAVIGGLALIPAGPMGDGRARGPAAEAAVAAGEVVGLALAGQAPGQPPVAVRMPVGDQAGNVLQVAVRQRLGAGVGRGHLTALGPPPGGAVVFVASRRGAEKTAEFLKQQGWACEHFHAGLPANEKAEVQERFITGGENGLRVIVATNAFGMGVDKPDVRLVVHAEIPGSLENYLQEAGRAGRDQQNARCVLLYDGQDIDTQFGLGKSSQLEWRDLKMVWKRLVQLQIVEGPSPARPGGAG